MSRRYKTKSESQFEEPVADEILTAAEAAKLLKIHEITLFLWARENRGPPALTPPGVRLRRYSKHELLEWLRQPHQTAREGAHA